MSVNPKAKPRAAPAPVAEDRTDPGGPSPEALARSRAGEAKAAKAGVPDRDDGDGAVKAGPGDATLIYDKNKKQPAGESPRLLVVAGPRTGSEYVLTELETSIGRGSDNTLVIPDISVSRRHVVILREGEAFVVQDQRSGNGTRVNGKNIDRHTLATGDEIAMGDTVVRFVEPGGVVVKSKAGRSAGARAQAPRPQEDERSEITQNKVAPAGLGKRKQVYALIAVVLVAVIGFGAFRKAAREKDDAAAAQDHDEGKAFARKRFEEGVRLLKDGRWSEARDKLKMSAELDPANADVQRYLERAEAEAPRAQALMQAKVSLQKKDYVTAKGALASIPDHSALADAAREVSAQLKAAQDSAVREARIRAENGDGAGALALLEPVLQAEPGRADALAVKDALAGHKVAAAPKREREKPAPVVEAAPVVAQQGPIIDSYLAGDLGGALERAEAGPDSRSKKLAEELRAFDEAYRDGLAKTQVRNLAGAVKALEVAEKLDRSLSGGRDSKLGKEVRRALGNLHYNLGVASLGSEEQLPQAAMHLRAALAADPGNDGAKRQLAEAVAHAKEIFQRGYFEKESDPEAARKAFKLVVDALPGSDETAQKAKRWLDKLDGKTAPEE